MLYKELFSTIELKDKSALPSEKEVVFDRASRNFVATLNRLFPYVELNEDGKERQPMFVKDPQERAKLTLAELIGTDRTRIGLAPSQKAQADMMVPVLEAVKDETPISLVTVWGTPRDPKNPQKNYAELADASTLLMLKAAADRIKLFHAPGAWIRVFVEDAACLWLDTEDLSNTRERAYFEGEMEKYFQTQVKTFHLLSKAVGGMPIEIVQESELLTRMGYPKDRMLADCAKIEPYFYEYLTGSDEMIQRSLQGTPYSSWLQMKDLAPTNYQALWEQTAAQLAQLASYKKLQEFGWVGVVTPEMRKFYLGKNAKLKPEIADNNDALYAAIAKYFSSTLLKATLGTAYFGLPFPDTMVRIPIAPQSDARPAQFERLVPLRSAPSDTKRDSAPEIFAPWSGQGYFNNQDGNFHVGQFKECGPDTIRIPVELTLSSDPAKLGKQEISYKIPAHVVI